MSKRWGALWLSIIIHLGLFFGLPRSQPPQRDLPQTTILDWVESPGEPAAKEPVSKASGKPEAQTKTAKEGRPNVYRDLSPPSILGSLASSQTLSESAIGEAVNDKMQSMGLGEYSNNISFFEAFSLRLHRGIDYPMEFLENYREGQVWVKALINEKGELLNVIDYSMSSPELTTYVLVCLLETLGKPLPKRQWYTEPIQLPVMIKIDFQYFTHGQKQEKYQVSYFKNRFELLRRSSAPDKLSQLRKDYARYIPPLIPTPGGLVFDFVQAYQMIEAWQNLTEKNLRAERWNNLQKKLLKKIEKANGGP